MAKGFEGCVSEDIRRRPTLCLKSEKRFFKMRNVFFR